MYNDYNNVLMPMSDDYLGYFIEGDGNITTYVKRYVGKTAQISPKQYFLGSSTFQNKHTQDATCTYIQQNSVTHNASYSTAMSVSVNAKLKVREYAEGALGVTTSDSVTVAAGTSFSSQASAATIVKPGETVRISAYLGGIKTTGVAVVDRYINTNSRAIVPVYNQTINVSDTLVEAYSYTFVVEKIN